MRTKLYGALIQIVKIDSESCTVIEDVIDEDQEVLEVWLIKLTYSIVTSSTGSP